MASIALVDLDNVELVAAVEQAFGIAIADAEAERCMSVGDLHALVLRKVAHVERGAMPCLTASAFRKLRSALQPRASGRKISPRTPLSSLMPAVGRRIWWKGLRRATGLKLPALLPSPARAAPIVSLVLAAVAGLAAAWGAPKVWGWALTGGAAATFLWPKGRGAETLGLGPEATVGDLARIVAALNAGRLAAPHGALRKADVWRALEGVIRDFTGYSGPIDKRVGFKCV